MKSPEWKKKSRLVLLIMSLYFLASSLLPGCKEAPKHDDHKKDEPADKGQIIYTCSMHPQIRQSTPGKCPICGMDLIPVSSSEGKSLREYNMTESAKSLAEIETAPVERKFVSVEVRLAGKVDYDETKLAYITAYFPGRIEHLWIDYTGIPVEIGHKMATIYSPEILSTQEELLQALKAVKDSEGSTIAEGKEAAVRNLESVREKLRLWGLTSEQVKEVETQSKPSDRITINSPVSGIVIKKDAVDGMYIETGMQIYAIADLSRVWVKLDAYESDLKWIRYGQNLMFTTEAYPAETFTGKIAFIDPIVNPMTRTIKVRVNVPNTDGRLKPEMFVRAVVSSKISADNKVVDASLAGKWISPMHPEIVKDGPGMCDICGMPLVPAESLGYVSSPDDAAAKPLVIPETAPLLTGKRAIVYVQVPDRKKPTFDGREIVLGARAGDYYIVKSGLAEGELVVTKGTFKIDSALQLEAKPSMMSPEGGISIGEHHNGEGTPVKTQKGDGADTVSLPAAFVNQIKDIEKAHDAVSAAVKSGDLKKASIAFAGLEKTVSSVDKSTVPENALLIWNELSMLLKNDAVEGRDAQSIEEAGQVVAKAATRIEKIKASFGIVLEKGVKKLDVPAEFKTQLQRVFDAYVILHEALASDNNDNALKASVSMVEALGAVDMLLLKGDTHMAWMSESAKLKTALDGIKKDDDIETVRKNFALVSDQLAAIMKMFGIPSEGNVYRIKCPMAFDGRGATWLQKDTEVRNPYFGASGNMYTCGDVIEEIPSGSAKELPK
jgi:membrane fusion protein, copper/silver efflux system